MPDPSPTPSNADSLKLQLPTARKKEWWPAIADSLPPGGYLSTVIHTTLAGIEPTTFRLLVRRATETNYIHANYFVSLLTFITMCV